MNNAEINANFKTSAAVLWASAFVILALIIVQAGRTQGNAAYAEVVADRGSYTLMTAASGKGGDQDPDEILYVIDSREQTLLVYEVEDARKKQVVFREGQPLDQLFQRARQ